MRVLNAVIDAALIVFGTIVGLILVWPAVKAWLFWADLRQKHWGANQ
jgi:hypothetical protein